MINKRITVKEIEDLKKENEKLRQENMQYKKTLKQHGIKARMIKKIDTEEMIQLFGFKCVNGTICDTSERKHMNVNYNTLVSNLIRVIMPYPRGNKNGWISSKPFMLMTDFEFEETQQTVKAILKLLLESKQRIRKGEVEK